VLQQFEDALLKIFHHYGKTVSAARVVAGGSFDALGKASQTLDLAAISLFCRDAQLVPGLATRTQLTDAFRLAHSHRSHVSVGGNADDQSDPLAVSFSEFKEILARLALAAYPKTKRSRAEALAEPDVEPSHDGAPAAVQILCLARWLTLDQWRPPGVLQSRPGSASADDLQKQRSRPSVLGPESIGHLQATPDLLALTGTGSVAKLISKIFVIYAAKGAQYSKPDSFDGTALVSTHMDLGEFLAFLKDFEIYPHRLSRDAAVALFKSRHPHGGHPMEQAGSTVISIGRTSSATASLSSLQMTLSEFRELITRLFLLMFPSDHGIVGFLFRFFFSYIMGPASGALNQGPRIRGPASGAPHQGH